MNQAEILQQFKQLDRSSPQFPDQLTNLLHKKEYKECILDLRDEDVVWLVNYLDEVLESLQVDPSGSAFRRCLRELGRICGARQRLPRSYTLETSLSVLGSHPVASGGSGDVYEGSLNGSMVCVKRLRIYAGQDSPETKKAFYREAVMWKRLIHPNIVPLIGITLKPLQLISAWMPGGELKDYIAKNPNTNRLRLLFGIADGLNHLHCRNVVHGDLKGPNILVDDAGCPRITDFGLAMVAQNQDSIRSAQGDHGHTARWTSPEILIGEGTYSKEADLFSFAMVMVEVFTGQVPFHPKPPPAAMLAILGGKRPERPAHPQLTAELWALMETCWDRDPHSRPEISAVLEILRNCDPSFPNDWTSNVPTPLTLPEFTESETTESSESSPELPILGTNKSNLAKQAAPSATPGERIHRHDEGSGEKPIILTDLGPLRRETDQSVNTPLPIDPPQFSSDQQHNLVNGYPRTNFLTDRENNDIPEDFSDPRVRGNSSRSSPQDDSVGQKVATRQPPIQEVNHGASRSVLTLSESYQAGNNHDSKSQNPSLHSHRNDLGNSSRSQLDLSNDARNRSQLSLKATGKQTLSGNPSETPLSRSNSNPIASRHKLQTETKSRIQSQTDLSQGLVQTSTHSDLIDGKPHNSSGSAEPATAAQPNDTSHTLRVSKGTQGQHAHTDLGRKTSEKDGSRLSSGVITSSSHKDRGIWYRIKRILCCASDESISS